MEALSGEATAGLDVVFPDKVVIGPSLAGTAGVDTGVAVAGAAVAVLIGAGEGTVATTTVLGVSPMVVFFGVAAVDGVEGTEMAATWVGAVRDVSGSW